MKEIPLVLSASGYPDRSTEYDHLADLCISGILKIEFLHLVTRQSVKNVKLPVCDCAYKSFSFTFHRS